MSDNFAFTPGSGLTGASDDVGGVHYQITKQADGTLNSTTLSKITVSAATTTDPGLVVRPIPFTGYTLRHYRSAASNNATVVKSSAGTVGLITASNTNASARWLPLYDKATTPAPATDTGATVLVGKFLIPGNTSGTNIPVPARGLNFVNGIGFAIVALEADADNTSVAAGDVHLNIAYT